MPKDSRQITFSIQPEIGERMDELVGFISSSNREYPVVFAGREKLIGRIATQVEKIRSTIRPKGFSELIQGAPGAGKSSLLKHLALQADENTDYIEVSVDTLANPAGLLGHVIEQSTLEPKANFTTARSKSKGAKAGFQGTGAHTAYAASEPALIDQLNKGLTVLDVWKYAFEEIPEKHVFVLLVDETQRLKGNKSEDLVRLLQDSGTTPRILPIYAGLGNTKRVLDDIDLSRIENVHNLSALSINDAEKVVRETLDSPSLGLTNTLSRSDLRTISHEFARASDGWPSHLHVYMREFLTKLHDQYTDIGDTGGVIDLDTVLEEGNKARIRYYDDRLSHVDSANCDRIIPALTEIVATDLDRDVLSLNEIRDAMERQSGGNLETRDVRREIDAAIRAGVLEVGGRNSFRFPIPSISSYIKLDCDEDRMLDEMRATHVAFIDSGGRSKD